jgi:hypothetical protein
MSQDWIAAYRQSLAYARQSGDKDREQACLKALKELGAPEEPEKKTHAAKRETTSKK